MRLRATNLKRKDQPSNGDESYNAINWDYIFGEDNPLSEWQPKREERDLICPNDEDDEDKIHIPSSQLAPLVWWPRGSTKGMAPTLSARHKGKEI